MEHRHFVAGMWALSRGKAAPEPTVDQLEVYWRVVERLTSEQWDHAVKAALETREKWIPPAGELLHLGWELRPVSAGLLPDEVDMRTPEQRKADAVETSRRLQEIVMRTVGVNVAPPEWPKERKEREQVKVVATEDRLAELRRQAAAIVEPELEPAKV